MHVAAEWAAGVRTGRVCGGEGDGGGLGEFVADGRPVLTTPASEHYEGLSVGGSRRAQPIALSVAGAKELRSARPWAGESRIRQSQERKATVTHHVAGQHTAVNTTRPMR
jgi:hypothetical protein